MKLSNLLSKLKKISNNDHNFLISDLEEILDVEKQKLEVHLDNNINENIFIKYETYIAPTITCGILTFNEERCIDRCLKSVVNNFDEVIVLDSYSTDSTTMIIKQKYPSVNVYQQQWENDFSYARNSVIKLATKEWIYFIDADNWIENYTKTSFKRVAKVLSFFGLNCVVSPIIRESNTNIRYDNRKMFSLNGTIKFYGAIHEEPLYIVDKSIPYNITIKTIVNHDGYNPKVTDQFSKNNRNLSLTQKMIKEEPSNPKWYYFLANELYKSKESENEINVIINLLEKSIEIYENVSDFKQRYYIESVISLIEILIKNKQFSKASEYCVKLQNILPNSIDANYYKSIIILEDINHRLRQLIHGLVSEMDEKKVSLINNSSHDHILFLIVTIKMQLLDFDNIKELYVKIKSSKMKKVLKEKVKLLHESLN